MSSITPTPLITCQNKDNYDLLTILLEITYLGSDGLLYIDLGGSVSVESLQVNLIAGSNPFALTKDASIVQFYQLVAGTLQAMPFNYLLVGPLLIIDSGDDYSNIVIKYI
jgi:hypothetical protein